MAKTNSDFAEHEKTYGRFMKMAKYSVIALAVLLVVLYVAVNP